MPDVYKTTDNQNFSVPGVSPSQINQLIWQGLPGKYIAAAADGLYTTIDGGVTWGKLYPNTEFATVLPVGAVPNQLAFSVGPNGGPECEPPLLGDLIAIGSRLNTLEPPEDPHEGWHGVIYHYTGGSWRKVNNDVGTQIYELAISPNNQLSINNADGFTGPFFWLSNDLGRTSIEITMPNPEEENLLVRQKYGADGGLWGWDASSSSTNLTLYKITENGANFDAKLVVPTFGESGWPICHLTDADKICVGYATPQLGASNTFTVSTSIDGGNNWTTVPVVVGNGVFTFSGGVWLASNRIVVVFTTGPDSSDPGDVMEIHSDDNGVTWSAPVSIKALANTSICRKHVYQINNAIIVVINHLFEDNTINCLRSVDEGVTWQDISNPSAGANAAGIEAFCPDPIGPNNTLYTIVRGDEVGEGFQLYYLPHADTNSVWQHDTTFPSFTEFDNDPVNGSGWEELYCIGVLK